MDQSKKTKILKENGLVEKDSFNIEPYSKNQYDEITLASDSDGKNLIAITTSTKNTGLACFYELEQIYEFLKIYCKHEQRN